MIIFVFFIIKKMVAKARKSFSNGTTKPYEFRLKQLEAMVTLLEENVDELVSALHTDLRKSKQEAVVTEVNIVMADVRNTILNLKEWMTPVKVRLKNQPRYTRV